MWSKPLKSEYLRRIIKKTKKKLEKKSNFLTSELRSRSKNRYSLIHWDAFEEELQTMIPLKMYF